VITTRLVLLGRGVAGGAVAARAAAALAYSGLKQNQKHNQNQEQLVARFRPPALVLQGAAPSLSALLAESFPLVGGALSLLHLGDLDTLSALRTGGADGAGGAGGAGVDGYGGAGDRAKEEDEDERRVYGGAIVQTHGANDRVVPLSMGKAMHSQLLLDVVKAMGKSENESGEGGDEGEGEDDKSPMREFVQVHTYMDPVVPLLCIRASCNHVHS